MKNAEIIADSINTETGSRITSFILPRFPKCLLAELNTHRMFSRNAASSRAMPINRVIENIRSDPYVPQFTRNKRGMGGMDNLTSLQKFVAESMWDDAMSDAINSALELAENVGVAKQEANRLLEPFMRVPVIVTATEWDNFFKLRCDPAAQPDFRLVAEEMRQVMNDSVPFPCDPTEWHVPFCHENDDFDLETLLKVATARCARISYATHDGDYSVVKDLALHDRLLVNGHLSPFEHCAQASEKNEFVSNFRGWRSYREILGRL